MADPRGLELLSAIRDRLRADLDGLRVTPEVEARGLRRSLARRFDLRRPQPLPELITEVEDLLRRYTVHGIHPRSFGPFHPPVREAGVVGEALAALFNPQLATWYQAPAAVEIEAFVLRYLAERLGLPDDSHASFTSGGLEANLSAVCTSLAWKHPEVVEKGLCGLPGLPVVYTSHEGHHSLEKVAQMTGLGSSAVRRVAVDDQDRLSVKDLEDCLEQDRAAGRCPLLVVATAGTTVSGAIDPLEPLGRWSRDHSLWFHVDAAWGGSAVFSERLRGHLAGIERADSVTWDAHKWLWTPMSAGMFFCRHPEVVARAFQVHAGRYVPRGHDEVNDPYAHGFSWGRRFRGLKVFLTLAELGESGVAALVDRQALLGDQVRCRLVEAGFVVVNRTPLPLICFRHPAMGERGEEVPRFLRRLHQSGRVGLSPVGLSDGTRAVRCCITSPKTGEADVEVLIEELVRALPG